MRGGGLEPLRVQFPEAFFHSLRVLRLKQRGWPGNPASGLPQTDATGGGGGGVRIHRGILMSPDWLARRMPKQFTPV